MTRDKWNSVEQRFHQMFGMTFEAAYETMRGLLGVPSFHWGDIVSDDALICVDTSDCCQKIPKIVFKTRRDYLLLLFFANQGIRSFMYHQTESKTSDYRCPQDNRCLDGILKRFGEDLLSTGSLVEMSWKRYSSRLTLTFTVSEKV